MLSPSLVIAASFAYLLLLFAVAHWADVRANEWLAINQFSIQGPKHIRRPDIILFVNGLPLVLIELKNPADENADIWKAYDQIQTYKEQVADVLTYNELLVISDGTEARMGSLSATAERFMQVCHADLEIFETVQNKNGQTTKLEATCHKRG